MSGKANNTSSPYGGDDFVFKKRHEKVLDVKDSSPSKHKVELQTLYLNQQSENRIMETLKSIHGQDFKLRHHSSYRDKGSNLKDQYWVNKGNLVVKAGIDYSAKPICTEDEIISTFAISKLEGYGFHKSHCAEALLATSGDVGLALEVLQNEYFQLGFNIPLCSKTKTDSEAETESTGSSDEELDKSLAHQREDEKNSLKSIYEDQFVEKIANKLWVFELDLEYLLHFHDPPEPDNDWDGLQSNKSKKKPNIEMCTYFLKGQCKYKYNCKYSHVAPPPVKAEPPKKHFFQLEIRFNEVCKYPLGIPFLFLTTQAPKFPSESCLRVSHRLIQEAQSYAKSEVCFMYQLVQFLLEYPAEMTTSLFGNLESDLFLNPSRPLFPMTELEEIEEETLESAPARSQTKRLPRPQVSMDELLREDAHLAKRFREKQKNETYKRYVSARKSLPAFSKIIDILNLVSENQVVVISGETGCGKSTQVPQFILDDWLLTRSSRDHVEIVCTQPRRISAIGVAERVAEERAERVGNSVGYQIRLESRMSSSTRLLFCTTGILLRRLESDSLLQNVTHIIVDEVHERSEESDFLLLIIKELLLSRPDLKVLLMSATLNAELFSQYFDGAPTIEIPGRTFPVEVFFLEDIIEMTNYAMEEHSKYTRKIKKGAGDDDIWEIELETADLQLNNQASFIRNPTTKDENLTLRQMVSRYQDYKRETVKTLYIMDPERINNDLIETVLTWIVSGNHDYPRTGSILVFLPGMAEINALHEQLQASQLFNPKYGKFILLPLHSSLTSEDQSAVFKKPKAGCRKVVLSTNIAETSVTIDDCVFVIDCGKMKEKRFDVNKNMESLDLVWVSRANALQRKGRAGRVMPGVCIHLYTNHRYIYQLLAQPIPELHRVPLEQLLLRIKTLPNFADKDPHQVLSGTLEPPADENIDTALARLKDVGALDEKKQLTALGRHLAALPVDVRVGKLMLFGAMFCCVDSCLTIAACLSYKSPFVAPFDKKELADKKKKEFSVANSDQITVLKAYNCWLKECQRSNAASYNFARENYLSQRTLVALADIKHQYLELLASIGFVNVEIGRRRSGQDRVLELSGAELNANGENNKLIAAILCTSLYPNVVKVLTPEKSFTPGAAGARPKDFRAEELKFKTRDDGYVFLHPTSVNHSVNNFTSPYLVYQEKVKTSRIFIRDCSMVPMLPLILFSGCGLKVELNRGTFVLTLEDGWIKFAVDTHEIAEMLCQIRKELIKLLEEKIEDPSINLHNLDHGKKIISTIVHLIS